MRDREGLQSVKRGTILNPPRWFRLDAVLLRISAWIGRQEWLRAVYGHLPAGLRAAVLGAFASPARNRASFSKTAAWQRSAHAPVAPADDSRRGTHPEAAGVNIYGYFRGQFGLGEGARLYAQALIDSGYPVALLDINLDIPHGLDDRTLDSHLVSEAPYDLNLILVNPDYFAEAVAKVGNERLRGGYVIACWFWELERIPGEWLDAVDTVDEVMVATSFVERAFRRVTEKPILRVPLPVGGAADSGLVREDFGLDPQAFLFLSSFDFNSGIARKNPLAAIEAFRMAFPRQRDDVQLLIKTSNGHRYPQAFLQLLDAVSVDPRIVLRDEVIDRPHVHALQRCADAYVSLHRAEGFGLGLAECMRIGKPVVATAWSGNTEFMTPANSCLVDYQLVPVQVGQYPHSEGQQWAEPDTNAAAVFLRRLVDEAGYAERLGTQASLDVRAQLSPRAAAARIIERLESIRVGRGNDRAAANVEKP